MIFLFSFSLSCSLNHVRAYIILQLFDCDGEPEEDSDGDLLVSNLVAHLRGKFDLEGPRQKDWRKCADFSKLALKKYNNDNVCFSF